MAIRPLAPDADTELRAARALGRAEAAELEARLRASELADRERLRAERSGSDGAGHRQGGRVAVRDATWKRLRREEAELIAYHDAILGSLPWRAAELARGLVGRAWAPRTPKGESRSPARPEQPSPPDPAAELARLEARVQELSSFQAAVRRSRTWRAIQSMRRLVGREW
jgi:hypothetical protein